MLTNILMDWPLNGEATGPIPNWIWGSGCLGSFLQFLNVCNQGKSGWKDTRNVVVICEQREVLMSVFGPFIQVHEVTCKGVDTGKSHPLRATLLGVSGLAPLMDFITCMGHPLNCRYYMLQPCADAQIRTKSEVITQTLQQVFSECYVICNVVFKHINCRGCPLCDCGTAQKACLLKCKTLFLYSTLCYWLFVIGSLHHFDSQLFCTAINLQILVVRDRNSNWRYKLASGFTCISSV